MLFFSSYPKRPHRSPKTPRRSAGKNLHVTLPENSTLLPPLLKLLVWTHARIHVLRNFPPSPSVAQHPFPQTLVHLSIPFGVQNIRLLLGNLFSRDRKRYGSWHNRYSRNGVNYTTLPYAVIHINIKMSRLHALKNWHYQQFSNFFYYIKYNDSG